MKVIVVLLALAVAAGLGVHYGRDKVEHAIHHLADPSLPGTLEGHRWAPVLHGHAQKAGRVSFHDGRMSTVRCHADLGDYSVRIDHTFTFQRDAAHPRAHCPGARIMQELSRASRVDADDSGRHARLTFSDSDGHTVLRMRAVGH